MKNLMNKMKPYMRIPNIVANRWVISDNIRKLEIIEVRRLAYSIFFRTKK